MSKRRTTWTALAREVLAVAVEGAVGDWAAYIGGVPGENHDEEWERIAKTGAKLRQEVAEVLFPSFKHLEWRP